MNVTQFKSFCEFMAENGVRNIRIMGGEPSMHPNFIEMVELAQNNFDRVTIFTNGLSDSIRNIVSREQDGINLNFTFSQSWNLDVLSKLWNMTLAIVITSKTNVDDIKKELCRITPHVVKPCISLSLDCTANIFTQRRTLVEKFEELYSFCTAHSQEVIVDHALPVCFLYGTKIPMREKHSHCIPNCAGLVDSNFNLRFCNLYSKEKLQLFVDNRIVPIQLMENFMTYEYYKKQIVLLDKICKDCVLYGKQCTGGCFMHSTAITMEDILDNTQLPIV